MQSPIPFLCLPLLLLAALWRQDPEPPAPVRERNWREILGPTQAHLPNPRPEVTWFDDLDKARSIAAREGRPLFVVMRCLPCKQCADFDAAVLEGGSVLEPLLRQFLCVRLTSVQSVDLRQFPMQSMQDLDLSWWGWFLSPAGSVYGVFGGKDETGDRARISVQALATTLKRVLDHHFDPRRGDWNVDIQPTRGDKPITPFDLPGFTSWARRFADLRPMECLHCHQVAEILRQPAIDAKKFDKARDLQLWPYPENIGIEVVRDDGLLVGRVIEGSPAALAGLAAGDRIGAAGQKKLFSQADLRAALQHIAVDGGPLLLRWKRKDELMEATLALQPGWKKVVLAWRESVADGNIGAHPGFAWPNALKDEQRKELGIASKTMAIRPYFGKDKEPWLARKAGLNPSDLILAVNGRSPDLSGREFLVWFRMLVEPGESVSLRVRDSRGVFRDVQYTATASGR